MATCPTCRKRHEDSTVTCPEHGEALLPDAAFSNADADLSAGTTVGEYNIEAKLGEGGFGAVYRATHPLIGKTVAIKVLNRQYSSNPQMVSRFISEARSVNQIRNRNIIDIFSFGALDDGRQYYVMELLEGQTFDRLLKERGKLTPEEAIPILRGIARALDAAHGHGIAHRDLKPENVFLVFEDDGGYFPKLLDFGIAKLMGDSQMGHKTQTGTPMGTPQYMSPEQCRGRNVDQRTDIYSFGIVAFEALSGQVPFTGADVMEVLMKQTTADPPPLSSVSGLPQALDQPIFDMMQKDPARRPATLGEAVERLADAAIASGFAIAPAPQRVVRTNRSGDGLPSAASRSTPGSSGAFVEAKTEVSHPTLGAQATDVKKSPPSRAPLLIGLAVVLIGGVALGVTLTRTKEGSPATASTAAPAPTGMPSASATIAAAAPTVTPVASAAPAALPTEVAIDVQTKEPNAEVWRGKDKIGSASSPVKLPRGDAPVTLTIKAPGYKPMDVSVTPTANVVVPVTLQKAPSGGAKTPGGKDLEF